MVTRDGAAELLIEAMDRAAKDGLEATITAYEDKHRELGNALLANPARAGTAAMTAQGFYEDLDQVITALKGMR